VAAHLQEAAIVEAFLADKDRLHRRLRCRTVSETDYELTQASHTGGGKTRLGRDP
jgi:hypothetical protein